MKGVNQYWRRRGWERVEFAASSERRHSNRSRRAYILWMYSRRLATYSLPLPLLLLLLFASLDEANGMETRGREARGCETQTENTSLLWNVIADSRPIGCRKLPMQASLNTRTEKRSSLLPSFNSVFQLLLLFLLLLLLFFFRTPLNNPVPTLANFQPSTRVSRWSVVITWLA